MSPTTLLIILSATAVVDAFSNASTGSYLLGGDQLTLRRRPRPPPQPSPPPQAPPRILIPLLQCHYPSGDGAHQATLIAESIDPPGSCRGMPRPQHWRSSPYTLAVVSLTATALLASVMLNGLVLWLLHAGRIRLSDFGVISICMNAASDLVLAVSCLVGDYLAPSLPGHEAASTADLVEALGPALMCRFRSYISQSCLTMDLLMLASLMRFARPRHYDSVIGAAPCGIFIYPSFVAFFSLGGNIWYLVLFECRNLAFGYSHRLWSSLPVLLSDEPAVARFLFCLSLVTQIAPVAVAAAFYIDNTRRSAMATSAGAAAAATTSATPLASNSATPASSSLPAALAHSVEAVELVGKMKMQRHLRLAAWLVAVQSLSLPTSLAMAGRFLAQPSDQRVNLALLAVANTASIGLALMLALKPVVYLTLHPDIRRALQHLAILDGSRRSQTDADEHTEADGQAGVAALGGSQEASPVDEVAAATSAAAATAKVNAENASSDRTVGPHQFNLMVRQADISDAVSNSSSFGLQTA